MMNTKRILVGGLLAATIIVVAEMLLYSGVLADAMAAAQAQKGVKPEASWGGTLYLVTTIPLGLLLAWLYAAIRPRFGPGPATALRAGGFLWVATWLVYYVWLTPSGPGCDNGLLFLEPGLTALVLTWELAGVLLAALATGWVYREREV
jgi:hypothetical protein